jgi:cytidylate kinase
MILNNKIRVACLLLTRYLHNGAMYRLNTYIALIPHSEEYPWQKL